jgi:hypothetical protein
MGLHYTTLIAAAAFAALACGETNAPLATPPLDGSFVLTRVNGKTLPDTIAMALPSGPGNYSGPVCPIVVTTGVLTFYGAVGRFSFAVNARICADQKWVFDTDAVQPEQRIL